MPDYDDPRVERMALITLQIWSAGDAKALFEDAAETGFIPPTDHELKLAERFSDYVVEGVCKVIADHWEEV